MGVGVKREAEEGYARAGLLPGSYWRFPSSVDSIDCAAVEHANVADGLFVDCFA
jgi:hypothetical protein